MDWGLEKRLRPNCGELSKGVGLPLMDLPWSTQPPPNSCWERRGGG